MTRINVQLHRLFGFFPFMKTTQTVRHQQWHQFFPKNKKPNINKFDVLALHLKKTKVKRAKLRTKP